MKRMLRNGLFWISIFVILFGIVIGYIDIIWHPQTTSRGLGAEDCTTTSEEFNQICLQINNQIFWSGIRFIALCSFIGFVGIGIWLYINGKAKRILRTIFLCISFGAIIFGITRGSYLFWEIDKNPCRGFKSDLFASELCYKLKRKQHQDEHDIIFNALTLIVLGSASIGLLLYSASRYRIPKYLMSQVYEQDK